MRALIFLLLAVICCVKANDFGQDMLDEEVDSALSAFDVERKDLLNGDDATSKQQKVDVSVSSSSSSSSSVSSSFDVEKYLTQRYNEAFRAAPMSPSSSVPAFALPVLSVSCVVLFACIALLVARFAFAHSLPKMSVLVNVVFLVGVSTLACASIAGIVVSAIAMNAPQQLQRSTTQSSSSKQRFQLNNQRIYTVPVRMKHPDGTQETVLRRFMYAPDARGRMRARLVEAPPEPHNVPMLTVGRPTSSSSSSSGGVRSPRVTTTKKTTTKRTTTKRTTRRPSSSSGRSQVDGNNNNNGGPPNNARINGNAIVGDDGVVRIQDWSLPASSTGRAAGELTRAQIGDRVLAVYIVSLSGDRPCGGPFAREACQATCDLGQLRTTIFDGPKSVANFYRTVSNGQFNLKPTSQVFIPITVDGDTTVLNLPNVARENGQLVQADYHAFYYPTNYHQDLFAGNAAGLGVISGEFSWMVNCEFFVFAHEWGHNLGLGHSGAFNGESFQEYQDFSSVMSAGMRGGDWRGLSSLQLYQLGWLTNLLTITKNGQYKIASTSESSESVPRAARLDNGWSLWLSWREEKNHDIDIKAGNPYFATSMQSTPNRYQGGPFGSLLLHMPWTSDQVTQLVGTVLPGSSIQLGDIVIKYAGEGSFEISGLPA